MFTAHTTHPCMNSLYSCSSHTHYRTDHIPVVSRGNLHCLQALLSEYRLDKQISILDFLLYSTSLRILEKKFAPAGQTPEKVIYLGSLVNVVKMHVTVIHNENSYDIFKNHIFGKTCSFDIGFFCKHGTIAISSASHIYIKIRGINE